MTDVDAKRQRDESDTARAVEVADLNRMGDMNIDDVYVLMDVQLRERPGPRVLYQRWEKQNWAAYDIDFTEDKVHWQALPPPPLQAVQK